MRKVVWLLVLLMLSISSFAATVHPCNTSACFQKVGVLTYLGNDSQNNSVFTATVTLPYYFPSLTYSTVTFFVKGQTESGGPFSAPTELLITVNPGPGACNGDCQSAGFQALLGDGSTPFVIKSRTTGHLFNFYGVVNTFIIPKPGHQFIQPGDSTPIYMQIKSITY